jgi:RimK family alpha-L-glutamate ligase
MSGRACILGEPGGWHARRLAAGLEARGLTATIVRWQALRGAVALDGPRFGPLEFAAADVIAVRGMPGTSPADARLEEVILRMDMLGRIAAAGTPVVNPPRALEVAIDKYLTLTHLAEAGLSVPRTVVVQDRASAARARAELGGDVVVKPLFGSRGRGLVRIAADDPSDIPPETGGVVYLQEFVPHAGWDVRVLVVGERLFAMRRRAAPGEWRTNLALGGLAEPLALPAAWGDLARRAAAAVGAPLAGVDLLPARDGRVLVLEVNAVPGWRGLELVVGPEVAEAITDQVVAAGRL